MFEAHAKRLAAERVHNLKNAMITGVWSNSNYDDENKTRDNLLARIDEFAESALDSIYNQQTITKSSEGIKSYEEVKDSPFWRAAQVPRIDPAIDQELKNAG